MAFLVVLYNICFFVSGSIPDGGIPDMTRLSELNEETVNANLRARYDVDRIYVSFILFGDYMLKQYFLERCYFVF